MKWPVETIDVVVQVNPKLAAADRPDLNEIVCFVPMAAVSEETLSIEAQAERPFSEVAKGYTPFKRGDVLVAKITPCFENGKMALADNLAHELGFGTTEFHVFRPSERITGPYLFNLLRAPYVRKAGAMKMKGAAGQRRVPADFFAALTIPLPPLAEQKRIAGFWMRRTPCGPSAARPSPSSTPSSNPPSSTCSATPSPIPWVCHQGD